MIEGHTAIQGISLQIAFAYGLWSYWQILCYLIRGPPKTYYFLDVPLVTKYLGVHPLCSHKRAQKIQWNSIPIYQKVWCVDLIFTSVSRTVGWGGIWISARYPIPSITLLGVSRPHKYITLACIKYLYPPHKYITALVNTHPKITSISYPTKKPKPRRWVDVHGIGIVWALLPTPRVHDIQGSSTDSSKLHAPTQVPPASEELNHLKRVVLESRGGIGNGERLYNLDADMVFFPASFWTSINININI